VRSADQYLDEFEDILRADGEQEACRRSEVPWGDRLSLLLELDLCTLLSNMQDI
jgi:hypothetical protein